MRNSGWLRCASVVVPVVLCAAPTAARAQQRAAYEELQTFSGVLNHIRLNYPDSVSYTELVAAAIRGVLRRRDGGGRGGRSDGAHRRAAQPRRQGWRAAG